MVTNTTNLLIVLCTSTAMDVRSAPARSVTASFNKPWQSFPIIVASTSNGGSQKNSIHAETTARVDSVRVSRTTTANPTKGGRKEIGSNYGTELDPAQLTAAQDHHSCTHNFYINKTLVPLKPLFRSSTTLLYSLRMCEDKMCEFFK